MASRAPRAASPRPWSGRTTIPTTGPWSPRRRMCRATPAAKLSLWRATRRAPAATSISRTETTMSRDLARASDMARVGAALAHGDAVRWRYHLRLEKRWGDWTLDDIRAGRAPAPYEVIEREKNLLMT